MENDTWYRQLLALALLSATRAGVEWLTNPDSRKDATDQLKSAFAEIDYDAAAKAITRAIENMADTSKSALSDTIDTIRDKGVGAVDEAKNKAQEQLAPRRGNKKRFVFAVALGAVFAYFLLDEQRRDDLLDRLTGASGPIEQASSTIYQQAASSAQHAADRAPDSVKDAAQAAADETKKAADKASEAAK